MSLLWAHVLISLLSASIITTTHYRQLITKSLDNLFLFSVVWFLRRRLYGARTATGSISRPYTKVRGSFYKLFNKKKTSVLSDPAHLRPNGFITRVFACYWGRQTCITSVWEEKPLSFKSQAGSCCFRGLGACCHRRYNTWLSRRTSHTPENKDFGDLGFTCSSLITFSLSPTLARRSCF